MRNLDHVFVGLARSAFRTRFRLSGHEQDYLRAKGLQTILAHARDFIAQRLAPAHPVKDGRQTPFRGHPVFVAQHATGTCCRSCLSKWHGIPQGRVLTVEEQHHIVATIGRWLGMQMAGAEQVATEAVHEKSRARSCPGE